MRAATTGSQAEAARLVTVTTLKQALAAPRAPYPARPRPRTCARARLRSSAPLACRRRAREDWRYTDLKTLVDAELDFAPRGPDRKALDAAARALAEHGVPADVPRLVFVDGHLAPELGSLDSASGVEVRDLDAYWLRPDATRRSQVSTAAHPLAALNTAYAQSGAWLRVRRRRADRRRRSGSCSSRAARRRSSLQPRIVVEIGRGADVTIVQHIVDAGRPTVGSTS